MRKLLLGAVALAVLGTAAIALAYDVPDVIVIERPRKSKPLADWVGKVNFPHGKHAVLNSCNSCHHKESAKTLGDFVACTQCHSGDDPRNRTDYYMAWHAGAPQSCVGCHTDRRAAGGKNPVGCRTACHKPIR